MEGSGDGKYERVILSMDIFWGRNRCLECKPLGSDGVFEPKLSRTNKPVLYYNFLRLQRLPPRHVYIYF